MGISMFVERAVHEHSARALARGVCVFCLGGGSAHRATMASHILWRMCAVVAVGNLPCDLRCGCCCCCCRRCRFCCCCCRLCDCSRSFVLMLFVLLMMLS